jgi:hypothetical protein
LAEPPNLRQAALSRARAGSTRPLRANIAAAARCSRLGSTCADALWNAAIAAASGGEP